MSLSFLHLCLSLALLSSYLASADKPHFAQQYYYRTILQTRDSPAGANPLLAVLDPGHVRMSYFYTASEITAILNAGKAYILYQFGIDFDSSVVVPVPGIDGAFEYPGFGVLYPYGTDPTLRSDNPYKVAADSRYKKRGDTEEWVIHEYGFLILTTNDGTFSSGNQTGTNYTADDILSYTNYNFLNVAANWTGHPCHPADCREVFTVRSNTPMKRPVNSYGIAEEEISAETLDDTGRLCETEGASKAYVDPNGDIFGRDRIVTTCAWLPSDSH